MPDSRAASLLRAQAKDLGLEFLFELSNKTESRILVGSLVAGVVVLPGALRIAAVVALLVYGLSTLAAERNVAQHPTMGWYPFVGNDPRVLLDIQENMVLTFERLCEEANYKNFDLHFGGR
jgi:hypothetical protein